MLSLSKEAKTLLNHTSFNSEFVRELVIFAEKTLGAKTKRIFRIIALMLMNFSENITLTWLAIQLEKQYLIPLSTAKWHIRKLIDLGLIKGSKGNPPRLTLLGQILYWYWRDGLEETL